jgi:hypothetical protein
VQALSSAGDLVIPSRKAAMHPRIEWQRYKIDRNRVHVLTRLTRSGPCKPTRNSDRSQTVTGSLASDGVNTIRRLADYILENSGVFVRSGRMPTVEEVQAKTAEIRATGEALLQLAAGSETRRVSYEGEFEVLLNRLHALGSYPTNRQVSDAAHAIQGEEVVGRWRQ